MSVWIITKKEETEEEKEERYKRLQKMPGLWNLDLEEEELIEELGDKYGISEQEVVEYLGVKNVDDIPPTDKCVEMLKALIAQLSYKVWRDKRVLTEEQEKLMGEVRAVHGLTKKEVLDFLDTNDAEIPPSNQWPSMIEALLSNKQYKEWKQSLKQED